MPKPHSQSKDLSPACLADQLSPFSPALARSGPSSWPQHGEGFWGAGAPAGLGPLCPPDLNLAIFVPRPGGWHLCMNTAPSWSQGRRDQLYLPPRLSLGLVCTRGSESERGLDLQVKAPDWGHGTPPSGSLPACLLCLLRPVWREGGTLDLPVS